MTTHPDPNPMTDEQTKAGAVLPKGWTLTCPYPEAMELKFAAPGGGYQTRYYTVRGEGIIYAFLKALHESTPQPRPEQAGSVVPDGLLDVLRLLQRVSDCCDDSQAVDISRKTLDALTTFGFLRRVQRSPARWEMTEVGQAVIAAAPAPKETP